MSSDIDIDAAARAAAEESPEFSMNLAASMFGGFARPTYDPRWDDPDWLPEASEIGTCLNWRVMVLPYRRRLETQSGIDLSAAKQMEDLSCYCGRIIDVGSRVQDKESMHDSVKLKRGMYVIYKKFAGVKVKWRGIEIAILNDDHIDVVVASPDDWTFYL